MTSFNPFPTYDEVHVISDIHMGGKPGFQILRETQRLAGYIGWVAAQAPAGNVALVLNGDVFDTLAEDNVSGYVAMEEAAFVVNRIMDDPSFKVVWDAFAQFVAQAGRTLVFVIGNHDIEMAFPTVQNLILWRLAGDDLQKKARIVFSTTGAGYTCLVGEAKVYCTHGNEVDAWNYNRYEDLSRVARRLNAAQPLNPKEWSPNAGTRMVKEVMNEVKKTYRWIDLLKPETSAAVGTLVVLDPSQASKITKLVSIVGEKVQGSKQVDQRLSTEGFKARNELDTTPVRIEQLLGPSISDGLKNQQNRPTTSEDDMLLEAEKSLGNNEALIATPDQSLGTGELIWDRLTGWMSGVGKDEALRRALKDWLKGDTTFKLDDVNDETYKAVTAAVGSSIDFIITGHTHLERAIAMPGNRFYFNCGTWIRLLKFTDNLLQDTASFQPVYQVLTDTSGRIEVIDNATFNGVPFVLDQTSAVVIKQQNGKTIGQLNHVEGDGTGQPNTIQTFVRA